MKKLVVQTQYLENYGSRENPYMKFKGGSTYVMPNCGEIERNEIATLVAQIKPYICTDFKQSNGGMDEYITDVSVELHQAKVCEDWESVTQFNIVGGNINFLKVTDNRDDGWMKAGILEKTESWSNDRENYKAEYLMDDGDFVLEKDLNEWFKENEE